MKNKNKILCVIEKTIELHLAAENVALQLTGTLKHESQDRQLNVVVLHRIRGRRVEVSDTQKWRLRLMMMKRELHRATAE